MTLPWAPGPRDLGRRSKEARTGGKKMGLCARGLHRLARFCPGRNTPFLTFLDNGLVQEAYSWLIHGLQLGEEGSKGSGGPNLRSLLPRPLRVTLWSAPGCLGSIAGETKIFLASPCKEILKL